MSDSLLRAPWLVRPAGGRSRLRDSLDLVVAALLIGAAAVLASTVSGGNTLRIVATLAILFTVPGYVLLQAAVGPFGTRRPRARHLLLAVGLSPVVVGLLALATAWLPGGFRAGTIIATVTGGCIALAVIAFVRRSYHARPDADATPLAS